MRCIKCVNSTNNPSRTFDSEGICNVCNEYRERFSLQTLENEKQFLKTMVSKEAKIDCLAAVSGGKDSIAMLQTICDMGFHPLAFTFDIGYNRITDEQRRTIERATEKLKIKHEYIDARQYLSEADRKSLRLTADFYDDELDGVDAETVRQMFVEERYCNSPMSQDVRPFIRPCRLCRRPVIRGYYAEAMKRNVSIVFLGINEWCGIHNSSYSAIRKLEPIPSQAVYIVHFPFLIQRRFRELSPILDQLGWSEDNQISLETGASGCMLARIAESKIVEKLGFNPDETRLAREVTAGFITREQALGVLNQSTHICRVGMKEVLIKGGLYD